MKRNKIFKDVCSELQKRSLQDVANKSGVHYQTLYKWVNGPVVAPRISTLIKVAKTLGYKIELIKTQARMRLVA